MINLNFFGSRIKDNRLSSGIGLRKLARLIQVSSSYMSRIESGECRPSEELVTKISEQLGLDFDDLMVSVGRIPSDIHNYIVENPTVLKRLRTEMGTKLEPLRS